MRYFLLLFFSAALLVILIAGRRGDHSRVTPIEVFPDMNRQLKLRPMQPNGFFANGISSQLPPANTVARTKPIESADGPVYAFQDTPVFTGHVPGTTNYVETNPLPITDSLLHRGQQRFTIYCTPCHGQLGEGNGITKKIGAMAVVANLHDKRIVELTDGEVFNTVTYGKGNMQGYGPQIPVEDRWAIIAYLRALQLSHLGTVDDLSAEQRANLK
jgi:mono/diheme cytochrome c family protein